MKILKENARVWRYAVSTVCQNSVIFERLNNGDPADLIACKLHKHTGAQWLSSRVLDSRPKGRRFEPHRRHCIVVLEQDTIYPSLVLVQPRKTRPYITERLLMGRKESNQTNKNYLGNEKL